MLIVNSTIKGCNSATLDNLPAAARVKESEIVFVCNKNAQEFTADVYVFLRDCLRTGKRVYLVIVGKIDHKLLSNLFVAYGAYDIYPIDSERQFTESFVKGIRARSPGILDVSQYVGCSPVAYGTADETLLRLRDMVDTLDIPDELADSLYGAAEVFEYLRSVESSVNFQERDRQIARLQERLNESERARSLAASELASAVEERDNAERRLETERERAEAADKRIDEAFETQAYRGTFTVQPCASTDTNLCRATNLLYFKEITHVPYINTFIKSLVEAIRGVRRDGKRLVCKLVIFDFSDGAGDLYAPLPVVDSDAYMSRRDEMAGTRMEMVINSPQLSVLQDLVTGQWGGADKAADVIIVYDRTRQGADIVKGKIVTKFWVCHSRRAVESAKTAYGIDDLSGVVTRYDEAVDDNQLDIPKIKGYKEFDSVSRKLRSYLGVKTIRGRAPLIDTVMRRAKVI